MNTFQKWLKDDSKIILFDGAMGTQIMNRGIKPGKLPDLLNIEEPEVITEIHHSYYKAGSDMCQTNTFGSNLMNLKKHNLEDRLKEINEAALDNISRAQLKDTVIVGDIGPSGEFKPPIGNATHDGWRSSFLKQAKILQKGVDLWHIETISDLDEMLAAIDAVKEISDKPIISSMTYRKTKKGFFTIMGNSVEECVSKTQDKATIIGTNCTLGSQEMLELLKEIKKYTTRSISVKPNAGKPRLDTKTTKASYDQSIEEYVQDIHEMIDLGAKIVGGCCGTSPKTIKQIRNALKSKNKKLT
ncbi:MAG: Bifunctional homocysteine S-methyltransferase/5,10-methylenetetrahydrofolate reductase [Promethearchaeota archaeon]|nr:MAG: Bifunctional homocysteine S-methyltransferase/5,10-methylenetetrahydrofolate reductase [Candidatus Lokiarchaeota archaeon]